MINWIISRKDVVINIDKWSPGNPLWVTGSSGDGKSTLAREMAIKHDAEVIASDIVLFRMGWSHNKFENFKNGGLAEFANAHGISTATSAAWDYINQHPELPYELMDSKTKIFNNDKLLSEMNKFYTWLMEEMLKPMYADKLYIIEGSNICGMDPCVMKEKPLIVKGGCRIKSLWRRSKRDSMEKGCSIFKSVCKYIKKYPMQSSRLDSVKESFIAALKR